MSRPPPPPPRTPTLSRPCPNTHVPVTLDRLEPRRLLALAVADVGPDLNGAADGFDVPLLGTLDASTLDDGDVRLENLTGNWFADENAADWALSYDDVDNTVQITIAEGNALAPAYLPDGNYELTVWAGDLDDVDGSTLAETYRANATSDPDLFFLAGDANRDRSVSISDFAVFNANNGQMGVGHAGGDFNGDGVVNISDFAILRSQFGRNLELPPSFDGEVVADYATIDSVRLSWDLPDAYDGFRVYRTEGESNDYALVAELRNDDADATNDWAAANGGAAGTWQDRGLIDGTSYRYDVRAFTDAAGNSPWTDDAEARTLLHTPTNVEAGYLSDGGVFVAWDVAGYNATHFYIEYTLDGTNWVEAGVADGEARHLAIDHAAIGLPASAMGSAEFRVTAQQRDGGGVGGVAFHSSGMSDAAVPQDIEAYSFDFEHGGYTGPSVEHSPARGEWSSLGGLDDYLAGESTERAFYGMQYGAVFDNESTTLTLKNLPPHSMLSVQASFGVDFQGFSTGLAWGTYDDNPYGDGDKTISVKADGETLGDVTYIAEFIEVSDPPANTDGYWILSLDDDSPASVDVEFEHKARQASLTLEGSGWNGFGGFPVSYWAPSVSVQAVQPSLSVNRSNITLMPTNRTETVEASRENRFVIPSVQVKKVTRSGGTPQVGWQRIFTVTTGPGGQGTQNVVFNLVRGAGNIVSPQTYTVTLEDDGAEATVDVLVTKAGL